MVSCGIPFGGCAIIWRQSLDAGVTPIVTVFKRVYAVKIQISEHRILLFNVYVPYIIMLTLFLIIMKFL